MVTIYVYELHENHTQIKPQKKQLTEQLTENLKPSQLEVIERRLKIVNRAIGEYRKQIREIGTPIDKTRLKDMMRKNISEDKERRYRTVSPRRIGAESLERKED